MFSKEQLTRLEAEFRVNHYPGAAKRHVLAQASKLPEDRIRVWFQNRRAKEKRMKEDELALSLRMNYKMNMTKTEVCGSNSI